MNYWYSLAPIKLSKKKLHISIANYRRKKIAVNKIICLGITRYNTVINPKLASRYSTKYIILSIIYLMLTSYWRRQYVSQTSH